MTTRDLDDRRVTRVVESSLLFGLADRALARAWHAAASSVAVVLVRRVAAAWREVPASRQRFTAGLALLAAAATHVALMLTGPVPPGWLWLLLPGLFATAGLMLMALSRDIVPKSNS